MRRTIAASSVLVVLMGLPACSRSADSHLSIQVQPSVLVDSTSAPLVSGARPGRRVHLSATARDSTGHRWSSQADFMPSSTGKVDLAAAPVAGSYTGGHATGLLWSMSSPDQSGFHIGPTFTMKVTYTASQTGSPDISATQTRTLLSPGEKPKQLSVKSDGFYGYFFAPPAGTPPASSMLLFGGSEGGVGGTVFQAALQAAHGHPTLALAYFDAPGIPKTLTDIPIEYFGKALTWLGRQPGVDSKRLIAMGGSRGSEAAMLLATHYPDQLRGVVAASPTTFVNTALPDTMKPAWTWHGKPLPHAVIQDFGSVTPGTPDAIIPIERFPGPVMFICGQDDLLWASCPSADQMAHRLGSRAIEASEPNAGHLVGFPVPNLPLASETATTLFGETTVGGDVEADAIGRLDAWPKLLQFFDTAA